MDWKNRKAIIDRIWANDHRTRRYIGKVGQPMSGEWDQTEKRYLTGAEILSVDVDEALPNDSLQKKERG